MQCIGITKKLSRCKNATGFFFCRTHRLQPLALLLSISTIIGLYAGIYQDLVKPLTSNHIFVNKNLPIDIHEVNNNINKTKLDYQLSNKLEECFSRINEFNAIYVNSNRNLIGLIGTSSRNAPICGINVSTVAALIYWACSSENSEFGCSFDFEYDCLKINFFGNIVDPFLKNALFQADKSLKEYSFGQRFTGELIKSNVESYKNLRELEYFNSGNTAISCRLWFSSNTCLTENYAKSIAIVNNLGISASCLGYEYSDGRYLHISNDSVMSGCNQFAKELTGNYEKYSREEQAFHTYKNIVKVTALAIWLSQHSFVNKIDWHPLIKASAPVNVPSRMPLMNLDYEVKKKSSEGMLTTTVRTMGGVSLGLKPKILSANTHEIKDFENKLILIEPRLKAGQYYDLGDAKNGSKYGMIVIHVGDTQE